jgi:phytoene/squalene synthetase
MTAALLPPAAGLLPGEVLARSGSNFTAGFLCLDPRRRAGMTAIYAFCRAADDAVDDAPDAATARQHLEYWRAELQAAAEGRAGSAVGQALQQTMREFGPIAEPLQALLEGVAMDLPPQFCTDEVQLRRYCWCVAAAVGRACLPVLGATGPVAERYADALGLALQFTNILRDLATDSAVGRCYVPQAWLAEAAVDRAWLSGAGPAAVYAPGGPVEALCRRLQQAAQAEFAAAHAALRELPRRARRALAPARIMGAVYERLLQRLTLRGGDLRGPRVRVPRHIKMLLAFAVLAGIKA